MQRESMRCNTIKLNAMSNTKHEWFGMKVTPEQKRKIKRLAAEEGTSAKEAVMRLVEKAHSNADSDTPKGSFLDGIEDLVGSLEGPEDLSSSERYLENLGA